MTVTLRSSSEFKCDGNAVSEVELRVQVGKFLPVVIELKIL